jgi:hypothetical protein
VRLAQLTNRCNDDDLEYYVREAGDILGIDAAMMRGGGGGGGGGGGSAADAAGGGGSGEEKAAERPRAAEVLAHIFAKVLEWKKMSHGPGSGGGGGGGGFGGVGGPASSQPQEGYGGGAGADDVLAEAKELDADDW